MKALTIGATYRINKGILNGMEGKLVAYDDRTDKVDLQVKNGGRCSTVSVDIDLVETKVKTPRLRKYLVTIKEQFVEDAIIFEAPKDATPEDILYAMEAMDIGQNDTEIKGKFYTWNDLKGEVVVGVVQSSTPDYAKSIFRYSPHLLNAYELV